MASKVKPLRQDLAHVYPGAALPFDLGQTQFRFTAIRPDFGNVVVDDIIETIEWRDEGPESESSGGSATDLNTIPILRGSVTLHKPDPDLFSNSTLRKIYNGHRLRCEVFWWDRWRPLWEMRMNTDETDIDSGEWRFDLEDDMAQLALTNISCRFKKGKKSHTRGWYYHEIVRAVCRKYGIPVGQLARGTHRIASFHEDDQPIMLVLYDALQREIDYTGRNYVMRWGPYKGKFCLNITPLRRNPFLYTLSSQIRSATAQQRRRGTLATTVTMHGTAKKGHKRTKIKVKVTDRAGAKRYGYIERTIGVPGNVDSVSEARNYAKRTLAKGLKPVRLLDNFTHTGIPDLRRGDAVRVAIPDEGYVGGDGIVFVTSAVHTYGSGDYTMTLSLSFIDPQDPKKLKAQREKALRAQKRAKKGKKK
jgi:hypothetical protein